MKTVTPVKRLVGRPPRPAVDLQFNKTLKTLKKILLKALMTVPEDPVDTP